MYFFKHNAIEHAIDDSIVKTYLLYEGASLVTQMIKYHLPCRRPGFHPWVRNIPWRREWQPTPVFLPEESHRHSNPLLCTGKAQCSGELLHCDVCFIAVVWNSLRCLWGRLYLSCGSRLFISSGSFYLPVSSSASVTCMWCKRYLLRCVRHCPCLLEASHRWWKTCK